jgi:NAD(P)-dependent dehydrogenase (short-subunit alcohol dehydrogenase family)
MKKVIVLVGAHDRLAVNAARQLAAQGHDVIGVALSAEEAVALSRELDAVYLADFQDLRDVRSLAAELLAAHPRIHVLANDAGTLFGQERALTGDGHERTFQVNYLAPFLLTNLLVDRLIESRATVLSVSRFGDPPVGPLDLDDLELKGSYDSCLAYRTATFEQLLFTKELHRRFHDAGLASAAGTVDSLGFLAGGVPEIDFPSGEFFTRGRLSPRRGEKGDRKLARELWTRSERMVAEFLGGSHGVRQTSASPSM